MRRSRHTFATMEAQEIECTSASPSTMASCSHVRSRTGRPSTTTWSGGLGSRGQRPLHRAGRRSEDVQSVDFPHRCRTDGHGRGLLPDLGCQDLPLVPGHHLRVERPFHADPFGQHDSGSDDWSRQRSATHFVHPGHTRKTAAPEPSLVVEQALEPNTPRVFRRHCRTLFNACASPESGPPSHVGHAGSTAWPGGRVPSGRRRCCRWKANGTGRRARPRFRSRSSGW